MQPKSFHPLFAAPSPVPPRKKFSVTWTPKDGVDRTEVVEAYSPGDALSVIETKFGYPYKAASPVEVK